MITNRIFKGVILLAFLGTCLLRSAEKAQEQSGCIPVCDKNKVIFIGGSVEAIPYSSSLDNFKDHISSTLLETFPNLERGDQIGEFLYLIPSLNDYLDLRWHCHPSIGTTVPPICPR